jgi:hypothetical protein
MNKLLLLAALMILCLGLYAADPNGTKDIVQPPVEPPVPYNLTAELVNINDVLLCWENPAYQDVPMGFRIYCNDSMVMYIPGQNVMDCILEDVCDGCHQFYVTAYFDSQTETPPSNIVELVVTSNNDNTVHNAALALRAYPNPFKSGVNLSLANAKATDDTRLTIFNAKGQTIKTVIMRGKTDWVWNARDNAGNRVPAGIYFAKAVTGDRSTLVKLMLTQ